LIDLRPPPTTRELIKKFSKAYREPCEYIVGNKINSKELDEKQEFLNTLKSLGVDDSTTFAFSTQK
jgi:hypothetical protein